MYPPDFWGQLGAAEHEALIGVARSRVFPAGSVLCTEGEPTTHVFVLLSGWVKCITVTHDGRQILEALRSQGDVIGEIAGQVTGYRTATVQAVGAVDALIAGTKQFGDFLDAHPGAARAYRRYLAERHRAANEQQRAHALSSGARRLACLLLDLAEQRDRANDGTFTAPPPLSQEELASLIGGSRSTVTRALRDWRARHIIGTDPRHIEIQDRAKLLRIAGRTQQRALSLRGNPVLTPDAAQERCPLTGREFEYRPRRITRVPHQHELFFAGDFDAGATTAASLARPPTLGLSALPTGHPASLHSAGRLCRAATRDEGVDTAGVGGAMPPAPSRQSPIGV